jgi:hypothetical protein
LCSFPFTSIVPLSKSNTLPQLKPRTLPSTPFKH